MNHVCKRHGKPINPASGHPTYALSDGTSGYCQVCNVGHDTAPADALTERQINIGAAYLAAIDTGLLTYGATPSTEEEVAKVLARIGRARGRQPAAVKALRLATLDYFKKELRHGDPYFVRTIKGNLPWLFEEVTS